MSSWMPDSFRRRVDHHYDDVTHWLSVGGDVDLAEGLTGLEPERTVRHLQDHGVTHVLDLRVEWDDADLWLEHGFPAENYCYAPIVDDRDHVPEDEWFARVENFVRHFWETSKPGERLFVHCHAGINRGPSAAMLALLYTYPTMTPWEAFMMIRDARPCAGVVYAKYVGIRHILLAAGGWDGDKDSETYRMIVEFTEALQSYWTPERIEGARDGSFYRGAKGETLVVDSPAV